MNREQIIERISNFMVEDFEIEASSIHANATLKETLSLDSLDYIDLVVSIEQNFGIKVKPEDFQSMITFEDLYQFIEKQLYEATVQ